VVIYLVVGLPAAFTDWCAAALAGVLRLRGAEPGRSAAGTLAGVARAALVETSADLVVVVPTFDSGLAEVAAEAAFGPVVAIGDPAEAFAGVSATGVPPADAMRYVMNSCVAVGLAAACPGALRIGSPGAPEDPATIVAALARRLGLALAEPEIDAMLDAVGAPPAPGSGAALRIDDAPLAAAIGTALASYGEGTAGRQIVLGAPLFQAGLPPHGSVAGPIDVTGRARCLFFGGYVPLWAGDWDLRLVIDVTEPATEGAYRLEVIALNGSSPITLARVGFTAGAPGRQAILTSLRLSGFVAAVDFQLHSERAMFDGEITLVAVELAKRAA
jgi:hypothetical protein